MDELVALIFAFCSSNAVVTSPKDKETMIACHTYVTSCAIGQKSHWDKKKLEYCEQEGLSNHWEYKE